MLCTRMIRVRQIEVFQAVMVQGGITRAAEALHVTQPAVTRLIRDLETETGLTLFQRKGNRVYPTPEAEQLYGEVQRSFIGLSQVDEFARALQKGHRGALRIACMPALSIGFLPRFAADFFAQSQKYDLRIESHGSMRVRELVASGQADIGFSAVPFEHDLLTARTINDPAVAVVPTTHRLAARKVIKASDLNDQKVILIDTGPRGGHAIQSALLRRAACECCLHPGQRRSPAQWSAAESGSASWIHFAQANMSGAAWSRAGSSRSSLSGSHSCARVIARHRA